MDKIEVVLYTRPGCTLCDKAKAAIAASGVPVQLREVDIDQDEELRRRYTDDVPVVFVNGREAFRHFVHPQAFASWVRSAQTSPSPSTLARETCEPCRGGVPALEGPELEALQRELGGGWRVVDGHHLEKERAFPDFATALAFTNAVGAIAEQQGHHPDVHLSWGKVRLTIWTHKIDGLTRADFVLAAKIDELP